VLQCNLETRTRESAGRCGAWGMLPPIRLEDGDRRPCTLRGKGIVFGVCNLKLGVFVAQRTGRLLIEGYFQSMSAVLSFMFSPFMVNVV